MLFHRILLLLIPLLLATVPADGVHRSTSLMMYQAGNLSATGPISPQPRFILEQEQPGSVLLPDGAQLLTSTSHYLLLELTDDALQKLMTDPAVRRIEPVQRFHLVLDESREAVNLEDSWTIAGGNINGYGGSGVIVGCVDSGIDPLHADFLQADSSGSRIRFLNDYDTGRLWSNTEIYSGSCTSRDIQGHGTHVAGIMAGNGNSSSGREYAGIAPGAELIIIKAGQLYTDAVLQGVEFIFNMATELDQPAVVNLSLETRQGPHDGTSAFERMLSELCGPGRLLTVAAGNAGELCIHNHQVLPAGGGGEIRFTTGGEGGSFNQVDIWIECITPPELVAISPVGGQYPVDVGSGGQYNLGQYGVLQFVRTASPDPYNQKYNATLTLENSGDAGHTWRIQLQNNDPVGITFDAWSYNAEFTDAGCTYEGSVSIPATADSAIAVGAYVSRISWPSLLGQRQYADPPPVGSVAPFSNRGPGINGAEIPILVAPGMGVMAPRSEAMNSNGLEGQVSPDGNYILLQGTSMASPQVAGTLALALQKNPQLSCAASREQLGETASFLAGQTEWDEAAGSGLLDVSALLDAVSAPAAELTLQNGPLQILLVWDRLPGSLVERYQLERQSLVSGNDTTYHVAADDRQSRYSWLDLAVTPGEGYAYCLTGHAADDEELWRSGTVTGRAALLSSPLHLKLYPNPGYGAEALQVAAEQSGSAELVVFNLLGQELLRQEINCNEGVNNFPLNLPRSAAGVYFVIVEQNGYREVQKGLLLPHQP